MQPLTRIVFTVLLILNIQFSSCRESIFGKADQYRRAGTEAYAKGDNAEAQRQLKLALDSLDPDRDRYQYVFITGDLARVYSSVKKDSEAEALFRERMRRADQLWNLEPEVLYSVYDDLAIFYLLRNRYDEAQPLYRRAIELREKAFGRNDPRVAQGMELYASLLRISHHDKEADELAARAAEIRASQSRPG